MSTASSELSSTTTNSTTTKQETTNTGSSERKGVPPFFPIVRKGCEDVSVDLFHCLGSATPGDEPEALEKLQQCDFSSYEKCFQESLKKGPKPLVKTSYD